MRPFEWLFVLSFVPVVLLPFIPHGRRRRWLIVAVSLPAVACMTHIGFEGWRTQMVPLYVLTVLALASGLFALRRRANTWSLRSAMVASGATGLAVVLTGALAGWLLPVVKLPEPTGPHSVGIVDRELVDEARGRRLMVSIWYPAASDGRPAPLTHHPNEVMTALANLSGLPAPLFQHLRYVTLAASEGVSVLQQSAPFPVLVFSHGLVGMRLQNCTMLQELASWGMLWWRLTIPMLLPLPCSPTARRASAI